MPRVYIDSLPPNDYHVKLEGETARYLSTVLRLKAGDDIELFYPKGLRFKAVMTGKSRGAVEVEIKEQLPDLHESSADIVLFQGILKGQKMDLVIQKTTELGVKEIVPLVTERTVVRETRKVSRWQKIAQEASRQCGRSDVPPVREPVGIRELFAPSAADLLSGFVLSEERGAGLREISRRPVAGEIAIAIGPEGGFVEDEVVLAEKRGLVATTLGARILRAETAAITAVALVQFLCGGLGGK